MDEIDPPEADPEATLIEKTPDNHLPPPMTSPDSRPSNFQIQEIPLPLALGVLGLLLLIAVCIIGAILLQ